MSNVRILLGDCREVLKTLPENSVDSIVTDPRAGRPGKAFYRRRYGVDEGTGSIDLQGYAEVIRIDGVRPFSSADDGLQRPQTS
jgi:tRNA G10  N-methylase Trm11